MAPPQRLVVRTHAPLRRWLLIGGIVVLGIIGVLVAFEWGRDNAGFDGRAARLQRSELHDELDALESENRQLRLKVASLETERTGSVRERTELGKSIADLQADNARLTTDLAFYRSVAGDTTPNDLLKIQQFRVTRSAGQNQYLLRLVLARPLGKEDAINGTIRMTFEGTTAATPVNLDLSSVSGVSSGQLSFNYRYSQTIEQPIQLPAGFTPVRTSVEISPARKGVNPVRTSFIWTVEN